MPLLIHPCPPPPPPTQTPSLQQGSRKILGPILGSLLPKRCRYESSEGGKARDQEGCLTATRTYVYIYPPIIQVDKKFGIRHYAGEVSYNTEGERRRR